MDPNSNSTEKNAALTLKDNQTPQNLDLYIYLFFFLLIGIKQVYCMLKC